MHEKITTNIWRVVFENIPAALLEKQIHDSYETTDLNPKAKIRDIIKE